MDAFKNNQKFCMSCQQWKHISQIVVRGGRARCTACINRMTQHQEKEKRHG